MTIDDQSCNSHHKEKFLREALNEESFASHPLPSDASPRKYERITSSKGKYMLMDASLDKGSIGPFISVAEFLHGKGYSAPKIFAKHEERGLLLLEDLGETSYSYMLANSDAETLQATEKKLYKKAIDLLVDLHLNAPINEIKTPSYEQKLLLKEAILLVDWYFPVLIGEKLSDSFRGEYIEAWKKIFDRLHYIEDCLVLRDYHVDNLIWMEDRSGIKRIGVLDFQDAVKGSYAYDVVSLLEDARRDVNAQISEEMLQYYMKQIQIDQKKFLSDYKILGVQRSCKIIGIFARKAACDNDSRYLKHLPRVWNYIKKNIDHPILEPLKIWFEKSKIPVMKNRI
jgi:aminoglycoside/choline kinase family phosphotransferase